MWQKLLPAISSFITSLRVGHVITGTICIAIVVLLASWLDHKAQVKDCNDPRNWTRESTAVQIGDPPSAPVSSEPAVSQPPTPATGALADLSSILKCDREDYRFDEVENKVVYYILTIIATLTGVLTSILVAIDLGTKWPNWGKTVLIVLPALGAASVTAITQFKVGQLWELRSSGVAQVKKLEDKARFLRAAGSLSLADVTLLYASLRETEDKQSSVLAPTVPNGKDSSPPADGQAPPAESKKDQVKPVASQ